MPEACYQNTDGGLIQLKDVACAHKSRWRLGQISFESALNEFLDNLKANHEGFSLKDEYKNKTSADFYKLMLKVNNELDKTYTLQDGIKAIRKRVYKSVIKGGKKGDPTINQCIVGGLNSLRKKYQKEPTIDELELNFDTSKPYVMKFFEARGGASADKIIHYLFNDGRKTCIDYSFDKETIRNDYVMGEKFINTIKNIAGTIGNNPDAVIKDVLDKYGAATIGALLYNDRFLMDAERAGNIEIILKERRHYKLPALKSSREWLTNIIIDRSLARFSTSCERYQFLKTSSRDYYNVKDSEVARFDLKQSIQNGKKAIGAVFNTALSSNKGEHWVCVVINLLARPNRITYFDSNGNEPAQEIRDWIMKQYAVLVDMCSKSSLETPLYIVNNINHQKSDTECGIYCVAFNMTEADDIEYNAWLGIRMFDTILYKYRESLFIEYKNN